MSGLAAPGEVFGRRDRGPNAASPSARYRASKRETQPWDTPYARATSPLGTALGNNSGDDQACFRHPRTVTARSFLYLETRHSYVLKQDTIAHPVKTASQWPRLRIEPGPLAFQCPILGRSGSEHAQSGYT